MKMNFFRLRFPPSGFRFAQKSASPRQSPSSPRRLFLHSAAANKDEAIPAPVVLTKDYIRDAYKHLEEVDNLEHRNVFFKKFMVEHVRWEIAGSGHELAGTRYSLADHTAASFSKLGKRLTKPIKFVVRTIILEPDTRWACVECRGYSTRTNGAPYNNEYVWLTEWNDEGKIFHVRSYHDTNLAEKVLHET